MGVVVVAELMNVHVAEFLLRITFAYI